MFEISVLRRLREELPLQPNLIRFYGVCLDHSPAEALCLVMEKLNGGELFDRIVERQRYTEKDAGHLFRGIVRAVSALHKANILHRDIKPENVLFVDTSYYSPFRLVDYGSAMFLDAPEKDPFKDKRIGSPGYTAPEVITNKPDRYKPPCDVFALGVLLFCLLVGYQPFPPEGPTYTLNVVTAHFDMDEGWEEVSEQAKDLVRKMLARSPLARISTADILAHPWVTDVELGPEERPLAGAQQGLKTMGFRKRFKGAALAAVWSARERLGRILN
jgi:serine/threonine protein kinase